MLCREIKIGENFNPFVFCGEKQKLGGGRWGFTKSHPPATKIEGNPWGDDDQKIKFTP